MSLNSQIADLIVEKGRAQAQGAAGAGQAWGSALSQIGQGVGQAIQQATDPRAALERQTVRNNDRVQNMHTAANGLLKQAIRSDGSTNYDFLRNGMAQLNIDPSVQEGILKTAESFDNHAVAAQNSKQEGVADLGHMIFQATQGLPKDTSPEALDAIVSSIGAIAKGRGIATDADLQSAFSAMHDGGIPAPQLGISLMGLSPSKRYAKELEPIVTPEGAAINRPGQAPVVPSPKTFAPTAASLAASANPGNPTAALTALQAPEVAANAARQKAQEELARHNGEMERISRLTVGREALAQAETARHNRETEKANNPLAALTGNPNATPQQAAAVNGDDFLKTLPPQVSSEVKAYAEGRRPFPSGMALKTPYFQSLIQMVGQYDPTFDAANYNARNKARTDLTSPSGTGGKTINALNTAIQHAGKLSDLIEQLDNTEYPLVNAVVNPLKKATGRTSVTNFNAVAPQLAKEIERAWRGAGGSTADIKELTDSIGQNLGKQQQREALSQFVDLAMGKLNATEQQRDNILGPVASKDVPILFDQSKPIIEKVQSRAAGEAAIPEAAKGPAIGTVRTSNGETRKWNGASWDLVAGK